MTSPSCLIDLKNTLPKTSWPQVIQALKQDTLIWKALQNPEFRGLAITRLGSQPQKWNPANLALLALNIDFKIEDFQKTSLSELNPELRLQAIQTYEAHSAESRPEMTLSTAGLLALALQEHYHMTNSWENIPLTKHWQTAFACLYCLNKQPSSLLQSLPIPIAIHAILANPLSTESQIKTFTSILVSATTQKRLAMIRALAQHHPNLAGSIAQKLWSGGPPTVNQNHADYQGLSGLLPTFESIQSLTEELKITIAHAEAEIASGKNDQSVASLQVAWQILRQLQISLATQNTKYSVNLSDVENSLVNWKTAQKPIEIPIKNTAELVLTLLQNGYYEEAKPLLDELIGQSHPVALLALACAAYHKSEDKKAKKIALEAAKDPKAFNSNQLFLLAKLFLDLRLPSEAVYLIEIAKPATAHQIDLIVFSAQAYTATGAYPQAIHAIHLATAYKPDQVELLREFARIHEYARQWPAAAEARKTVIETQCDPLGVDFRALAECVLKLKQTQQAEDACKSAIEINPNDGLALALLGETYSLKGKSDEAEQHFQESIRISSDQALPWLALARYHQRAGNLSEASETLRKGAHAAPEKAEIHLALGENYLQAGSPSQALSSLRKANKLAKSLPPVESFHLQSQIALPLAKTLFELGHADEALETIQAVHPLPENQPDALHLQAQILIFSGRAEQAIPLLAKALQANPADSAINLDYARAQLEAKNDPEKAIRALLGLLENDPENAEALAWLAEALSAKGDSANALAAYRKALATRLTEDPQWHPRLAIGLAQSALDLNQPEIALATLQRSWQTSPQYLLKITQMLATAYNAANLRDKAIRTARQARDMDLYSVESLTWFADFAFELQAYDDAANALNTAIELEPENPKLRLKFGAIQQQMGNISEAHSAFQSLADLDQATPQELHSAAKNLVKLNYLEDAIRCLKTAVGRCQYSPRNSICPELLMDLIDVYLRLGMQVEALAEIDEILGRQTDKDPVIIGQRAKLLSSLGRYDEANAALESGLVEFPQSNPLYLAAAQIHYAAGDIPKALEVSQKAIQNLQQDKESGSQHPTMAIAADIAEAGLQSQLTKEIMSCELDPTNLNDHLDYYCLRSEIALETGEEIDAAQALTAALSVSTEHPRVKALQARLTARHGDGQSAQDTLQAALTAWGELPSHEITSPAGILGISEAAIELQQWSTAIYLLQEAAEKFHQEPRTHLRLARGLVLRAEHQRLCETLRVIRHAPGASTLADYTYQLFEQAILNAAQTSEGFDNGTKQADITHWRLRGQAVFYPSGEHARALGEIPHTPESRAALLAALRHSREKQQGKQTALEYFASASHRLTQETGNSVILMVQIALALSKHNPKLAANAAQSALDASIRQKHPSLPIFYAAQALVTEQTGDLNTARSALENALSLWSDEARWHIWLAEIQKRKSEPAIETVIEHLSKGIELEPKHGAHHLKLGQAYLEAGDPESAIPVLEQAACLLSKRSEPRMALARAFRATGDIAQIFHNAEYAVKLDPKNIEPYLLLAESALDINNPEKAIEFCQSALTIEPENPQALIFHARALSAMGQSAEALQSFDQALEQSPKSISLMLEHAQLTHQAAGDRSAIKELQDLSDKYPEDPRVLASLAKALIDNDQPDPAIQAAQKALQTNQGILDCTQEAHLLESLGRLMRRNGQLDHAIHYLSEAIQCNPESIDAYLELGRVYQDRRQYPQALDIFQQAIAIEPGNAYAYYQAGQTLKATKDYAAAEAMLQNAAKLAPDDLAIRRQLGGLVALNLVHNRKDNVEIYVE